MTKPIMERRHFEAIAAIIRELKDAGEVNTSRHTAIMFANRLPTTNPSFNRARFLEACGVQS